MAQLRRDYEKFVDLDAEVVVVGPDEASKFDGYWKKHALPFVGLPDPKHKVLKLYGQQTKIFKMGRMPAQTIVDKSGIARYVHYGHDMTDIPKNVELLGMLRKL